jgi:long-chain acyl-CoA synthetase
MGLHDEIFTLADIPRYHGRTRPGAPATFFEGRHTTYAELDAASSRVARALIAAGLKPGDRIAHLGKNSDLYYELLWGAAKAGVVMVPVNWRLVPREVAYIVGDARARLFFVGPEFIDTVASFVEPGQAGDIIGLETPYAGRLYAAWRDAHSAEDPMLPLDQDDAAVQLYTSGTTGNPKGAVLTHRNFIELRKLQAAADIPWARWDDKDVSLVAMPCFHIGGTGWAVMGAYFGAINVIAREFDPRQVLGFITEWRITKMFLVPAAMQIVVRLPGARDVDYSCLRYMMYGASPIPLPLLRECMDVFGCGFIQMYGMTETTGTVVALAPEDHDPAGNERMKGAGQALPGVEIAILDDAGNHLGPGAVGEIATRSPANMKGYWNLPEATAATIDADGWLRTGDAGYLDEDGYLYVHDRVKDMIISGAENVYPAEVESVMFGHPDIADVAVVGIPSERWGEEVKAFVVLRDGRERDPAGIIAWTRERIAGYKTPKSIDFIDALPRNPSGKILRRTLRAPYWEGRTRQVN